MNTLSGRCNALEKIYPFAGNYLLLSSAIRGMNFGKSAINKAFAKYVPKRDYAEDERDELLENLWSVDKAHERGKIPLF